VRDADSNLRERLANAKTRKKKIYNDKLAGKIDEEFWSELTAECDEEIRNLQKRIEQAAPACSRAEFLRSAKRPFELLQVAADLYVTQSPSKRPYCSIRSFRTTPCPAQMSLQI
jgi:hypothetical protein